MVHYGFIRVRVSVYFIVSATVMYHIDLLNRAQNQLATSKHVCYQGTLFVIMELTVAHEVEALVKVSRRAGQTKLAQK